MNDLERFRGDAASWLAAHCPPSLIGRETTPFDGCWGGRRYDWQADEKRWVEAMVEKRWIAPAWPIEYGGGGLTEDHARIIRQEMARLKIPPPLAGFGLTMIGPALLAFGTEEQKREHLPPIVRGEIRWCQGYSEPGAGSDLASLRTSAVRDGDELVINGQKCWTSYADLSDWMFLLVRTDPAAKKQQGISFVLLDMTTPGVTVRPTLLISGKSPFCETFFEDVRVPLSSVVGGWNQGWTVGKAVLEFERSTHGEVFSTVGTAEENPLVQAARRHAGSDSRGRIGDAVLREQIAQSEMDRRCFELTIARLHAGLASGEKPGAESSLLKYYASEFNMRRQHLMTAIAGPAALGWEGEGFDEDELEVTRDWLRSRGNSIEGGTSEIQLGVIAKRMLGLPD
ncbi:MAG TPA: acyl-CoA dehydrogenase family protein [Candidatus Limnocylindrales bacterium]|nr:acyl-CoA dehydrogenase family protein [Candidatus Limnocylindrales bacterium]